MTRSTERPSGTTGIAIAGAVTVLSVGLMAWDHLWGNERGSDDSFPVDPATFLLALVLIVVTGLVVFGVTVPRQAKRPERVHISALIHSVLALVLALPASWLGFPVVMAGGGIMLGVRGLTGPHRRAAAVAIGVGLIVVIPAILGTAFPSADST